MENSSYEKTRAMVIAHCKKVGHYVDGYYTEFFEISKSGRAYRIEHEDRFYYVAKSACITDGNGCIYVPFSALESAIRFADGNGIYEYVGG